MTGMSASEKGRLPPVDGGPSKPSTAPADAVYRTLHSLRRSFIRIAAVVLLSAIAGYFLAEPILRHLQGRTGVTLAAYGIPETFFTFLNLALAFGVFVSMPYILYAILAGVQPLFPALTGHPCGLNPAVFQNIHVFGRFPFKVDDLPGLKMAQSGSRAEF